VSPLRPQFLLRGSSILQCSVRSIPGCFFVFPHVIYRFLCHLHSSCLPRADLLRFGTSNFRNQSFSPHSASSRRLQHCPSAIRISDHRFAYVVHHRASLRGCLRCSGLHSWVGDWLLCGGWLFYISCSDRDASPHGRADTPSSMLLLLIIDTHRACPRSTSLFLRLYAAHLFVAFLFASFASAVFLFVFALHLFAAHSLHNIS